MWFGSRWETLVTAADEETEAGETTDDGWEEEDEAEPQVQCCCVFVEGFGCSYFFFYHKFIVD